MYKYGKVRKNKIFQAYLLCLECLFSHFLSATETCPASISTLEESQGHILRTLHQYSHIKQLQRRTCIIDIADTDESKTSQHLFNLILTVTSLTFQVYQVGLGYSETEFFEQIGQQASTL